ncbi:MAG: glycerophosphodiester phosphodiesterase family protein [Limisphaerales bacterium]
MTLGLVLSLLLGGALASANAAPSEFKSIYAEFQKPESAQVLVAAHRGLPGKSTGAWEKFPENSLAAIADSIAAGVDIVEVDVHKTKDGQLVIMHDDTVDRTTDGTGEMSNLTLAELKQLHLRMGEGGTNMSDQRIPTLEEVMYLVKGKCMVNLDKAWDLVPECHAVLKKTETVQQAIFKSSYDAARCEKDFAGLNPPVSFMPIIYDGNDWQKQKQQGWAKIEPYAQLSRPCAVELIFTSDDDVLVAPETLAKIKQNGMRPWINTMWDSLDAGHTDAKSLKNPVEGWDWLIARGANIIQTDESSRLLEHLRARKLHW